MFGRRREDRRTRALVLGIGVLVVGTLLQGSPAAGEGTAFRVIVDPENATTSVSREMLAEAFLKTTTRWPNGESIKPIDQRLDSATRQAFSDTVLKRSVSAVRSYWQQRIFSGRAVPPPELDSDDAIVSYVTGHRGAVGYVSGSTKLGATKVVAIR